MTVVALFGAGGKMGMRLGRNLARSRFETRHVEISPAGQERIREAFGAACIEPDSAIAGAQVVILAVPDTAVGAVAAGRTPLATTSRPASRAWNGRVRWGCRAMRCMR